MKIGSFCWNCNNNQGPEGGRGEVQIRVVLKCTEKGVKKRRIVTEMVDWSACKLVEDGLTWHDDNIPADAVQRVEFHREARN